jgi:hypothetical protein
VFLNPEPVVQLFWRRRWLERADCIDHDDVIVGLGVVG